MKTLYTILLIFALSIFAGTPSYGGDDEALYALGGFILGQAINGNHGSIDIGVYGGRHGTRYGVEYRTHRGYDRGYGHYNRSYSGYSYDNCAPRGYWTTRRVQVWVPGYWARAHEGAPKYYVEGYYTWETERFWVETGRGRP